jgi:hypothetical protein
VRHSKLALLATKFDGLGPDRLFDHLLRKRSDRPKISDTEVHIEQLGLFYLQSESLRARSQRNRTRNKDVWIIIQPLLRRAGFLGDFDRYPEFVKKLKLFLSDGVF